MWLCLIWGKQFDDAFYNAQWRKVKQMQPMWLCLISRAQKKKQNKCNHIIPQSSYTLFLFWANQWFYLVSLVQKIGDPIFGLFAPDGNSRWGKSVPRPLSVPFLLRTSGKGTDVATPLGLEKYGRIDFALKKWTKWHQKMAKSRRTHAKEPWELVRLCFRSLFRP